MIRGCRELRAPRPELQTTKKPPSALQDNFDGKLLNHLVGLCLCRLAFLSRSSFSPCSFFETSLLVGKAVGV